uniref:Electron transport protein SCO1/SenC n=1 Tax=uncultured Chloroflexota bacterium TaxID=166587 RepID=H5SDZ5_9CHLR|nr:electron transport protein SCO1/SenC [uncultured Chloroflexota bacterium]
MRNKVLWPLLVIGLLALASFFWQEKEASLRGTVYDPPIPAPDFTLTSGDGQVFRLSEQRGRIVLLFFGYTSCPDVCPTTLAELKQVFQKLSSDEQERIRVFFITVDPQRDSPERVQQYANRFHPSFIGLSGSEEVLTPVWQAYGVYREVLPAESASGYLVAHSARIYLVDHEGNLRLTFPFGTPSEDILFDLKILLKKKG